MPAKKSRTCQICQTSFRGRKDAKTCSAACRKRLQRQVRAEVTKKTERLKSALGQEFHKLAANLLGRHVTLHEPLVLADERGVIEVAEPPIQQQASTDDNISPDRATVPAEPLETTPPAPPEPSPPAAPTEVVQPNEQIKPEESQVQPVSAPATAPPPSSIHLADMMSTESLDSSANGEPQAVEPSSGGSDNPVSTKPANGRFSLFRYNRTALTVTGLVILAITILSAGSFFLLSRHNTGQLAGKNSPSSYAVGDLPLGNVQPNQSLQVGEANQLAINGQLTVNQTLVISPGAAPSKPVTGQIYYDKATNEPYYYDGSQFVSLGPGQGVSSLGGATGAIGVGNGLSIANNQLTISNLLQQQINNAVNNTANSGVLSLSGTANQVNVSGSTGNVTLSLPQSIAVTSTPTFGGVTVNGTVSVSTLQRGSPGNNLNIYAGSDNIAFTANGRTFILPNTGPGSQTICTTGYSCAIGPGTAVQLQPGSAQTDTGVGSSIFINNTGGGNLLQLQGSGSDSFVITNGGNVTAAGTLAVQGSGGLSVGVAGSVAGSISLANTSNSNLSLLQASAPTGAGNATFTLPSIAGGSSDEICTVSSGNCGGSGGGVTTLGGTAGYIPVFTGAQTIADSILSQSGSVLTVAGNAVINTAAGFVGNLINLEVDSSSEFSVDEGGNSIQAGTLTINGTGTSYVAGTLSVGDGLTVTSGGADITGTTTVTGSGTITNTLTIQGTNALTLGTASTNTGAIIFQGSGGNGYLRLQGPITPSVGNYTLSIPAISADANICTDNSVCSGYAPSGGSTNYIQNGTVPQTADFNITGSGTAGTLNATTALELNGTDINTGGTLSNVAYLDQANNFSATNTFSAAGTGLSVTNNLTVGGTINTATITGGTLSGGNVSGGTLTATSVNSLNVSGTAISGTGALSIDASGSNAVSVGGISTGDILLGGGSSSTGCTVTNSTGALACAGNINSVGGGLQTAGSTRIDNSGNATLGTISSGLINGQTISSSANFTGTLAVQGASLSIGDPGTTAGSLYLANASSSRQVILQGLNPSGAGDATVQLPSIAGGSTDTVCLVNLGNCAGSGSGVTTPGGTSGTIALFTGSQSIADSVITQSGSAISVAGTLAVTGSSSLSLGTASTNTGSLALYNSSNANTLTLQSGATASNLTLTLPTADGSNGDCLQTNGTGTLSFGACTGGAGGGVTSLDGLTGVLTLANSSGSGATVTIDDASTSQKGIAQFNSTNFSASSGTINTIQDIATTSSPVFVSPNGTTGINTGAGAGTQRIDASGNLVNIGTITTSGAINGQTISSAANFTGTVVIQGANALTLGSSSANTGSVAFYNSAGTHTITLQGPSADPLADYTLTIPTLTGNDTLCVATLANCTAVGAAGGDLTGSYPNPTIASLQGTTLTLSSLASGDVLQYNGSAIVNGHITNSNLTAGSFGNITGVGALTSGSIASGFGTISTGNTITTTGSLHGDTLSAGSSNQFQVDSSGNLTVAAAADIQGGGGLTLGVASSVNGLLSFANSSNSNLTVVQAAAPSGTGNATVTIPSIAGGSSDTVCLVTLGNCAGSGSGVTTPGGTTGTIALFSDTQEISDSILTQSGTTLTAGGNLVVNAGAGFSGNLLNLEVDLNSKLSVDQDGNTTQAGTLTVNGTGASYIAGSLSIGTYGTNGTTALCSNAGQISTCASTGSIGYWNRTGTTLQPANSGDNITTSGNLSTTGSGTITAAGILNANAAGKTAIQIADSGAQSSGLTIGGDTTLYRNGSNVLATDGWFELIGGGSLLLQGGYLQQDDSSSASNIFLDSAVTGDTVSRFRVDSDGTISWGDGTNARDTNLYRSGAGQLATDDTFGIYGGNLYIEGGTEHIVSVQAQPFYTLLTSYTDTVGSVGFQIQADGRLLWSGGGAPDTNLYRSAANTLTTDDSFITVGDIQIQGGDLTTNQTTFNLLNTTATTLNVGGAVGSGGINLAGGSASTGCTVDGSNGNLTCSGAITTTATSGTQGWWSRSGTTLQPAASGDSVRVNSASGGEFLAVQSDTDNVYIDTRSTTADDWVLASMLATGDTQRRYILKTSGEMQWGSGTASPDVVWYRAGAGSMRLQSISNSTTAFQIQDSGFNQIFNVDAANSFATIRREDATARDVGILLQSANGVDWSMYSPQNTTELRLWNDVGGGKDVLTIDQDGEVGIDALSTDVLVLNNATSAATVAYMQFEIEGTEYYEVGAATDGTFFLYDDTEGQDTFLLNADTGAQIRLDNASTEGLTIGRYNGVEFGDFSAVNHGGTIYGQLQIGEGFDASEIALSNGVSGDAWALGSDDFADGGNSFYLYNYAAAAYGLSMSTAGAFRINPDVSNGTLFADITGTTTGSAVCHSGGSSATQNVQIVDCSGTISDYAEDYPVAVGTDYGDIVAMGSQMVDTYGTTNDSIDWTKVIGQVPQLVKSTAPYQTNTIGIVSDNYSDFSSTGHNIKDEDNPMPVALKGRLPVKVSPTSDPIQPGDYITTSTDPGKAMKATSGGFVIGKALESWTPGSGDPDVMVFVEQGHWPGPTQTDYVQNGSNATLNDLTVGGTANLANLNVSGNTTINNLTVTGSANLTNATITTLHVTSSADFAGDITVGGHIITSGGQPTVQNQTAVGTGASVAVDGTDTTGTITITTGSNPTAGDLAKILFSKTYGQAPHVVLSPSNDKAAGLQFYKGGTSATDFMLNALDSPDPNTTYVFDYLIAQ